VIDVETTETAQREKEKRKEKKENRRSSELICVPVTLFFK
jgi:hypothetical protein